MWVQPAPATWKDEAAGAAKESSMYRCMSPGVIGISMDWRQCLPLAKENSFEGFDVPLEAGQPASLYRDALAHHSLKPGGTPLPINFRGEPKAYDEGLSKLPAIARLAAEVGQTRFFTWILSASNTLPMKENIRFHVEKLAPAAKVLADHGCTLGLEFLGPRTLREGHKYTFVHTMEQMLELAAQVGPNCGLLLDCWHWYTSLGTVEEILTLQARQVVYVHVNDAPAGVPIDQQQDLVRRLPGATGVIDLAGFLDALRTIGYDGPVVAEPFEPKLGQMPPEEAARLVGQAMRRVWSLPASPKLPAKMQAIATGGRKAWLVELPVPRPQGHEVIVKLHACPICGSNMGDFVDDGEHVNTGHEGAGEVVAVAESNRLKVGDRVSLAPLNACGKCPECLRGDAIFCSRRPAVHGNFAQFTRVADTMCVPLPDDIDYVRGSLMGCALGPAYEAIRRIGLRGFHTVVVSGLGPVGLGAVTLSAFLGARVIALDPGEYRRKLAGELGAELTLAPDEDQVKEKVLAAGDRRGITHGIECSGQEAGLRLLMDLAGIRGQVAIVGENPGTVPISPSRDFIRKGLTVLGCWHMNINDAPDLIAFLRRAPHLADKLVSHRFPFGEVQQAFDTFASRRSAKVILLPWE